MLARVVLVVSLLSGTAIARSPGPIPQVKFGVPVVVGDLHKAIVRRYIKRNTQKLQYCYEKELVAKPGLKGVVTAMFTIGINGTVTESEATGIPVVHDCVARVIRGIEFPKPKDGGTVKVMYPLTFLPE